MIHNLGYAESPLILTALVTCALVVVLNTGLGSIPALGEFLSPQHGFWKNAEAEKLFRRI